MLRAIDHVQIAIPPGGEDAARPFYRDLLGLTEVAKTGVQATRGGCWFEDGDVKVHLGIEEPFRANTKAHVAFLVDDVNDIGRRAMAAGYQTKSDDDLEGYERVFIYDPFGNRLEFLKPRLVTLYRPVGTAELKLIQESGWRAFPPRLPDQPIFYPVTNEGYARQIARDWNARQNDDKRGYVTCFDVRADFLSAYERQIVGGSEHEEYWIPADDLAGFNNAIDGRIQVIAEYAEQEEC